MSQPAGGDTLEVSVANDLRELCGTTVSIDH